MDLQAERVVVPRAAGDDPDGADLADAEVRVQIGARELRQPWVSDDDAADDRASAPRVGVLPDRGDGPGAVVRRRFVSGLRAFEARPAEVEPAVVSPDVIDLLAAASADVGDVHVPGLRIDPEAPRVAEPV